MSYAINAGTESAEEYPTLISAMKEEHIFSIVRAGDGFYIEEANDHYYHVWLTVTQLRALGHELTALADGVTCAPTAD